MLYWQTHQGSPNQYATTAPPFVCFSQVLHKPKYLIGKKRPQTIMSLSLLTLDTNEESVNTRFPFVQELSDILCDVLG